MLIPALILAGGQARRMGGADKPLLPVGGRPILARILEALDGHPVAISANGDPARFATFRLPVLPDGTLAGTGPLGGLFAGLGWAASLGADTLLTVTGDMPFPPRHLARTLGDAPACAQGDRLHPLVAIWPVACRGKLRVFLTQDPKRRVRDFAAAIGTRAVPFPDERSFLNVNTPADLDRADRLARAGFGETDGAEPG